MRESLRRLASEDNCERTVGNMRKVRVELLDGEHITVEVDRKAKGADLLDKVCETVDIMEKDFFGLLYLLRGDPRVWVDLNRRLSKTFRSGDQIETVSVTLTTDLARLSAGSLDDEPWDVRLAVKFYPPEPSELCDDVTRYQISLAVRRDLVEGRLTCSGITHAVLASYVLQAELGDFEPSHVQSALLSRHRAAPLSAITTTFEENIERLYQKHKGQTPAEAELNYLENAKKLALYGAELHCARDSDLVDIVLAVCSHGISVYRDGLLMNRFPWTKIIKISYKKRSYALKLRASEFDEYETHVSFRLPSTRACKKLWKCSVEHHMFYRREAPVKVERILGFPQLGSRKLSCRRTLRQVRSEPAPINLEVTA